MIGRPIDPLRLEGVPTWLVCAGLLLIFAAPGPLLDLLGLGYGNATGSPLGKVHPGTDLIVLALIVAAIRAGNPLRCLGDQARRFPGAVALLGATTLLLVYLVKVQRAPFTPLIDTFVLPALLLPLLVDLQPSGRSLVERALHLFLAFNAALGIVEFATGWRLIPMSFEGADVTTEMEWRAAGLLGHPLASASTAGMYAVILAMGFGRTLTGWLRGPAIALQLISLGAFGGRTALVLTILCLAVLGLLRLGSLLRGQRFDRRSTAIVLLLAPVIIAGLVLLIGGGFFDQLLLRFVEDNGSARSRAIVFDIFNHFSRQELWLGPDQEHLASILHLEGIEIGVESFWLGFVVLCGIWMSVLFFIAFGAFLADVLRRTDARALVPLGFFMVIISTTISLSAKSATLAQFMVMIVILMPAPARSVRAGRPAAASALRAA